MDLPNQTVDGQRTTDHLSLIRLDVFWRRRRVGTFRTVIRSSSRQHGIITVQSSALDDQCGTIAKGLGFSCTEESGIDTESVPPVGRRLPLVRVFPRYARWSERTQRECAVCVCWKLPIAPLCAIGTYVTHSQGAPQTDRL